MSRSSGSENQFSARAGGAYDPTVGSAMPAWGEVRLRVARELGKAVDGGEPLVPVRRAGMTWAARAGRSSAIVVKVRHGDRAQEKTQWCAEHLPALAARGYPVPAILWHGMISPQWHVTVQNRFPGRPLFPLDGPLDGPILEALLGLVELQACAGIPAGDHDFTGYVANVLFDDWDEVWADAPWACVAAGPLCARLRRWLEPVWGLRLPAADYGPRSLYTYTAMASSTRWPCPWLRLPHRPRLLARSAPWPTGPESGSLRPASRPCAARDRECWCRSGGRWPR